MSSYTTPHIKEKVDDILRKQEKKAEFLKFINGLKGVRYHYKNVERTKIKIVSSNTINRKVVEHLSEIYDLKEINYNEHDKSLLVEFY